MQLCGSSEIDFSSEPTVAGTMVSFVWMGWDGCRGKRQRVWKPGWEREK